MAYSKEELASLSEDEKRALVKKLLLEKQSKAGSSSGQAGNSDPVYSVARKQDKSQFIRFDTYSDYIQLQNQKRSLAESGITNPYFKVHETQTQHQH